MCERVRGNPLEYDGWRVDGERLYRRGRGEDEMAWKQVVPREHRRDLLAEYHDDPRRGGHMGIYKTYYRLLSRFYWPRMKADVAHYVARCRTCNEVKPERKRPAGIMGTRPRITKCWQLISSDIFGPLPKSNAGHEYVLVITDYFSKFSIFVPMRTVTAVKVIREIEERVFLAFGVPEFMIVDNGVQFGRSRAFRDFLQGYGVRPYYNALYTPQNNPTERVNGTMKTAIMAYVGQDQRTWDVNLAKVACAIRTAKHESTRYTPYYINLGREMVDDGREYERARQEREVQEMSGSDREIEDEEAEREPELVGELRRVHAKVWEMLDRAYARAKRQYDGRRRDVSYEVGDYVWKREFPTSDTRKHFPAKIAKRYSGPYRVSQKVGTNVYELEGADGENLGIWHVKDLKRAQREGSDDEGMAETESSGEDEEVDLGESDESSE